jgi:ABC-type ATPase with predicted acetyltransferase domain
VSIVRTIDVRTYPGPRLLRACAAFGLAVRHNPGAPRPTHRVMAVDLLRRLSPGGMALITGRSGSGKSSLLNEVEECARAMGVRVVRAGAEGPEAPLIDAIDRPLPEALRLLAHAGLADATLFARTPAELSEGERARMRIARALCDVSRREDSLILIDEFASVLDRTTARCLCHSLRRRMRRMSARVVAATAHDDVIAWLSPDVHIRMS